VGSLQASEDQDADVICPIGRVREDFGEADDDLSNEDRVEIGGSVGVFFYQRFFSVVLGEALDDSLVS